jgi:GNAT superfamily N-acetyltransferase
MKMEYLIKQAELSDLESLHKYLNLFFSLNIAGISLRPDGISLDKAKEYIPDNSCDKDKLCLLARVDEAVAGNLTFRRNQKYEYRHSGEFGMTVLPHYQNRGIGSALLVEMEKWAVENGILRLELGVWSDNVNAIRLYKRHGYLIEGVKKKAIKRSFCFCDLILMVKMTGAK